MLSSTQEACENERGHIIRALVRNGYPRWLVHWYSGPPEEVAEGLDEQTKATISLSVCPWGLKCFEKDPESVSHYM